MRREISLSVECENPAFFVFAIWNRKCICGCNGLCRGAQKWLSNCLYWYVIEVEFLKTLLKIKKFMKKVTDGNKMFACMCLAISLFALPNNLCCAFPCIILMWPVDSRLIFITSILEELRMQGWRITLTMLQITWVKYILLGVYLCTLSVTRNLSRSKFELVCCSFVPVL